MGNESLIKFIIQQGIISADEALCALTEKIEQISLQDYFNLVRECKRYKVDVVAFFNSIYMKASEEAQYQMWKDGYVESCPVHKLITDICTEQSEIVNLISNNYGEDLVHCEAYFENIQDVIVEYLLQAKHSVKIAMAWFTNPVIFNTLLKICKRKNKVEVIILINNDLINNRTNGLPFDKLIQADAKFYIAEPPQLIHHKFCIIDDKIVIDGSYNWTILAEKNNDENIVVIKNGKTIDSFVDVFDQMIDKYKRINSMPGHVPENIEYNCCSYQYYNSEEWFVQIGEMGSRKKQYDLYKEIFKVLPEQTAKDKIPSDIFDSVKKDVYEERERNVSLFKSSIATKSEELAEKISDKGRMIDSISSKIERISEQKSKTIDDFNLKVEKIKSRRLSPKQKDFQIATIKRERRRELNKLSRTIAKLEVEQDSLRSELDGIAIEQDFITSIRDSNLEGKDGLFRINLKWNTADDLDLHLVLPNGRLDDIKSDVFYQHKQTEYNGGVCSLDHDAIPDNAGENPQENIIWEKKLPDGEYKVYVKLFNKKSDLQMIPFSITAFVGNYVKTETYHFNSEQTDIILITTLIFKNGRVINPIF